MSAQHATPAAQTAQLTTDLPYSPTGWYTISQFCARNPAFTESGIRQMIFHAGRYGIQDAIMRPGGARRVLVHEPTLYECLRRQSGIA